MSPKEFYKMGHFIRTKKDTTQKKKKKKRIPLRTCIHLLVSEYKVKIVKIIGKKFLNSLSKGGFNKITPIIDTC